MIKLVALLCAAPLMLVVSLAAVATGPEQPPFSDEPSPLALSEIPPSLLPVYRAAAATCPGMPWQIVAAVGYVESRHAGGRVDTNTGDVTPPIIGPALDGTAGRVLMRDAFEPDGFAHAHGPMQVLRATFARYAVLAPGRPPTITASPDNAWDAVYTATKLLCSNAGRNLDLEAAVYAYNHSATYVETVFARAAAYGMYGTSNAPAAKGAALAGGVVAGSPDAVVAAAASALGVPYVWGGASPETGFDCSGLVQWAYARAGVNLPRSTADQVHMGVPVPTDQVAPGDLVFSRGGKPTHDLGHVAIYIGGGRVIVAPHTGAEVSYQQYDPHRAQAVRRVLVAYPIS
jgi:cell wall-associated NlpC family hydrolase